MAYFVFVDLATLDRRGKVRNVVLQCFVNAQSIMHIVLQLYDALRSDSTVMYLSTYHRQR